MTRLILLSVCLLAFCGPGTLLAQEPAIVTTFPSITGERVYLVEEGDTLWGIAEQFFEDAHFWPTLWAFNPQITNPHWIYPGDPVIIFPRSLMEDPGPLIWADSRYTRRPKDTALEVRSKAFISERDFRASGKIIWSREEREMLGQYDEVYVEFYIPKKITRGEEFTVYRRQSKVKDPHSGKTLGWKVKHLGKAKIIGLEKNYAKALLMTTYEEIHRGDAFTEIFDHQFMLNPTANKTDLRARVIMSFSELNMIGENDYLFIDKGRNDGVFSGNRFQVLDRGDGRFAMTDAQMEELPWEVIGEIMVVEPYENTSLAVVTRSIMEFGVGQPLEMRRGYGIEELHEMD